LIYLGAKKLKPLFIEKNVSIEQMQKLILTNIFADIEIDAYEYKKEFNVNSNNVYAEMETIANRLYNRTIQYVDSDNSIVKKRWVITCKYNKESKKVIVRFHPDLIMDLLIFKNQYTILRYDIAKRIKNSYTYRIYELLKQYVKIGKRKFTLNDFRYKLGIPDEEYPNYSNLKQKIINPSLKWLNTKSDMEVDFEEIKTKNKVTSINFTLRTKEMSPKKVILHQTSIDEMMITKENSIYDNLIRLIKINVSPEEAEIIFDSAIQGISDSKSQIGVMDYIESKIELVKSYCSRKNIPNIIGVLISALKGDWTNKGNENIKSSFNDYEQRSYDFDALEKKLLGWD